MPCSSFSPPLTLIMLKPHEFLNLGKLWDTCVKHCFWGGGGVGHCDLKSPTNAESQYTEALRNT